MGVVMSSTEEGAGSSWEITSCAQLREAAPSTTNVTNGNVNNTKSAGVFGRRPVR